MPRASSRLCWPPKPIVGSLPPRCSSRRTQQRLRHRGRGGATCLVVGLLAAAGFIFVVLALAVGLLLVGPAV
jgi:hypothetical protein